MALQFVNQEGVNVTQRVEDKKTLIFTEKEKADKFANRIRSYVYDLRFFDNSEKSSRPKPYGWAVPR